MTQSGPEAKLLDLATQALASTESGAMSWKETDDPDLFLYSGARTSLMIDKFPDSRRLVFKVLNDRGRIVEEVSRMPNPSDPWGEGALQYEVLQNLHAAARRSALQIEATIEQAFADLDRPAEEPPF
jgi:hypothetical protein